MKRVIKFRAWDSINKEMIYPIDGDFFSNKKSSADIFNSWGDEAMQFIGTHDNTGKEIYEGDKVSCYDNDSKEHVGVIEYMAPKFCLRIGDIYLSDWANAENIIVIGNIYENPELLNHESKPAN